MSVIYKFILAIIFVYVGVLYNGALIRKLMRTLSVNSGEAKAKAKLIAEPSKSILCFGRVERLETEYPLQGKSIVRTSCESGVTLATCFLALTPQSQR